MSEKSPQPKPEAKWRKTEAGIERVKDSHFYEEPDYEAPHGYFRNRCIIGRDTPINKGVYLGAGQREAIIVDDKESKILNNVYQELFKKRKKDLQSGKKIKLGLPGILDSVFELVSETLPFNNKKVERITRKYLSDQKISLSEFIRAKAGICRHQALLAGYVLERLIKEDLIKGKVHINRNAIRGKGGHAWVRYTTHKNKVFILDPAIGFCGPIEDMPKIIWDYSQPET